MNCRSRPALAHCSDVVLLFPPHISGWAPRVVPIAKPTTSPLKLRKGEREARDINRDKTVALFLQGGEEWNAWANERLAERASMEADGCWSTEKDEFGTLHPKNDETLDWMERAAADFSGCLFIVATAGGGRRRYRDIGRSQKKET